jgi:hypothetical protein
MIDHQSYSLLHFPVGKRRGLRASGSDSPEAPSPVFLLRF